MTVSRQPTIAAALLLFAIVCYGFVGFAAPRSAEAAAEGRHIIRSVKAPIVADLAAPTLDRLLGSDDQWQDELDWARAAAHREMAANPQRLITLDLQAPLTFGALHADDRQFLLGLVGPDAPAAYENALARFLGSALDAIGSTTVPIVSIMGLPIEPGRLQPTAQESNKRYDAVIGRLAAFTSRKMFVIQGGSRSELDMLQSGLPEAFNLSAGRPIIFRTNDVWRMAYRGAEPDKLVEGDDREPDALEPSPPQPGASLDSSAAEKAPSTGDTPDRVEETKPNWSPENEVDTKSPGPILSGGGGGGGGRPRPAPGAGDSRSIGRPGTSGIGGLGAPNFSGGGSPGSLTGGSPGSLTGGSGGGSSGGSSGGGSSGGGSGNSGSGSQPVGSGGGGGGNGGGVSGSPNVGGSNPPAGWTPPGCDDPDYDPWANLHDFTGLPMTCDGWTDLLAMYQHPSYYNDTRIVYVSSSTGNDGTAFWYNPGVASVGDDPFNPDGPIKAYKTLKAAYAVMRNGKADMMLLKRADVWEESFSSSSAGNWTKNGPSPQERIILATYGTGERPLLNLGSSNGINCSGVNNLIVAGIRFYSHTWQSGNAGKGIDILSGGSGAHNQLHEDCLYERNDINRIQGSSNNPHLSIAFRRCIFDRTDDQSIYASRMHDFLIEECLFYSSGDKRRRHLYLSPADGGQHAGLTGVIVRGNIFFDASQTCISGRSGGVFVRNLFVRNNQSIAMFGEGGSAGKIVSGVIEDNVFLESQSGTVRGITIRDADGVSIARNIFTDGTGITGSSVAIALYEGSTHNLLKNIVIEDNINYAWSGGGTNRGIQIYGGGIRENIIIRRNAIQMVNGSTDVVQHMAGAGAPSERFNGFTYEDNTYFSTSAPSTWYVPGGTLQGWKVESGEVSAVGKELPYPYPDRTLKSYNAELGGASSTEAFMSQALLQSRTYWRPEYTATAAIDYFRTGFNMTPLDQSAQ